MYRPLIMAQVNNAGADNGEAWMCRTSQTAGIGSASVILVSEEVGRGHAYTHTRLHARKRKLRFPYFVTN
jgi:hypothetical protein